MKPAITVYEREEYGFTRLIAMVGQWEKDRQAPIWPTEYLFDIKRTQYYSELGASIYGSSISVYKLEYYGVNRIDQQHAEYMAATLKSINNRMAKIEENEGYCATFGEFVVRLARVLKAPIYYEHQSRHELKGKVWNKMDMRYARAELDTWAQKIADKAA